MEMLQEKIGRSWRSTGGGRVRRAPLRFCLTPVSCRPQSANGDSDARHLLSVVFLQIGLQPC